MAQILQIAFLVNVSNLLEVSKNIVESINKEILSLEIALSLTKMSKKVALNASRIAALCTDPILSN